MLLKFAISFTLRGYVIEPLMASKDTFAERKGYEMTWIGICNLIARDVGHIIVFSCYSRHCSSCFTASGEDVGKLFVSGVKNAEWVREH